MAIKPGWTHIITLSPDYAIFRSQTNRRRFATGCSPNATVRFDRDTPFDESGEAYTLTAGEDLLTKSGAGHRIRRTRIGIRLGCTNISLKELNAAGRKHRCLTLLISRKHRAKIAKLPLNQPVYVSQL